MTKVSRVLLASILILCHSGRSLSKERPTSIKDCWKTSSTTIDCSNLGFQYVPYDIFSIPKQQIHLGGNPFVCDCSMVWFIREPARKKVGIQDWGDIKCARPHKLQNKVILGLKEADICSTELLQLKDFCSLRNDGNWHCFFNKRLKRMPYDVFDRKGKINMYAEFICDCDIVWLIRRLKEKKLRDRFTDYEALLCRPFKKNRIVTPVYKFTESDVCPHKDIDECDPGRSFCQDNEDCHNKVHGYECRCKLGLKRENVNNKCVPHDPCKEKINPCPSTSICETVRLFFLISYRCVDINECLTGKDTCGKNEECHNKENGYECRCRQGIKREDGKCVSPIDPCKKKPPLCNTKTQRCVNGKNSNFYTCEDIDECATTQHNCHKDAKCINMVPGYKCECKSGFKEYDNGRQCEDVNECSDKFHCPKNFQCINIPGSYKCICVTGYVQDGRSCEDIDECVVNNNCGMYAECKNTPGSYKCVCRTGYYEDGKICKDTDECSQNACPAYSTCENTPGSYSCKCVPGFQWESGRCVDMDECKMNSHTCDKNALCINQVGGYKCRCNKGFRHLNSGRVCFKKDDTSKSNTSLIAVLVAVPVSLLVIVLIGVGIYLERKNRGKHNQEDESLLEKKKNARQRTMFMFNPTANRKKNTQDNMAMMFDSPDEERDYDDNMW